MQVQPYLFFNGRCQEALDLYQTALGAQVTALMHFKDMPPEAGLEPGCKEGTRAVPGEQIMHANVQIGDTQFMASDGRPPGDGDFKGFALTLSTASDAEAQHLFNALAEGGKVQTPLGSTFFASSFGMLADRYGVPWIVIVALPDQP